MIKPILPIVLASLALGNVPGAAMNVSQTGTGGAEPTDLDLKWQALARNTPGVANWQVGIGADMGDPFADLGNYDWTVSNVHNFTLTYHPDPRHAEWVFGDTTTAYDFQSVSGRFSDIIVQVAGNPADDLTVTVGNVAFNGKAVPESTFSAGVDADRMQAWIRMRDDTRMLSDDNWKLTGQVTITRSVSTALRNKTRLGIEILNDPVFTPIHNPTPSAFVLGMIGLGLCRYIKRRFV